MDLTAVFFFKDFHSFVEYSKVLVANDSHDQPWMMFHLLHQTMIITSPNWYLTFVTSSDENNVSIYGV